jgi:hypothetical protein
VKTVKVRMLCEVWTRAGVTDGQPRTLLANEIIDVPEDTAERWALYGWAVLADSEGRA